MPISKTGDKVCDAGDDEELHTVSGTGVTEAVIQDAEFLHAPDCMFYAHAQAGQDMVIFFFVFCEFSS